MTDDSGGAGQEVRSALRRCVPIPAGDFAERHWDRAPLLSRRVGDYTDLLDLDDVDELLSRRALRTPFVRMARQGKVIPAARYTGGGGPGAEVGDQVLDERVFEQLAGGATLVLQGLHRLWPPLVDLAGDLGRELGVPVQVNAYLTPPGNQGFATHYDTHAVFVLQVAGTKRWRVHPPVVTDPVERQPWGGRVEEVAAVAAGEPFLDAVLEAGDSLYLPRGWLHAAGALDDWSLHLTIGLRAPTRLSVVEALLDLAADAPSLRAGLPMGADPGDGAAIAPVLADTVKALHEWLDTLRPDDVAGRWRRGRGPEARPAPLRPVAQAAALARLSADDRVRLRPGLRIQVTEPDPEHVAIEAPDRTVTMPAVCAAAVRELLDGRSRPIADLPGLSPDDGVVLARRLLTETILILDV
ncbi:cupin domain-containing protein [Dactylosporangium sp. NPDC000521]|uniref:cupin domain-containing protein n=1 Tax=Dactylosporangium sp. NPDC000521 TaxID=3363975 RepID=UPI0036853A52